MLGCVNQVGWPNSRGKAVALSDTCWPQIAIGALPLVYPFIVNDPGEAAQAKRRTAAVMIGHLTPPVTDAGAAELTKARPQLLVIRGADLKPVASRRQCPPRWMRRTSFRRRF